LQVHQLEKEDRRIQSMMARSGEQSPDDLESWGDELDGEYRALCRKIPSSLPTNCSFFLQDPTSLSQSLLMDPSEVSSVVSNDSFQMVANEPVVEGDVGDTIVVASSLESSPVQSKHKKKGTVFSLSDYAAFDPFLSQNRRIFQQHGRVGPWI
jgi:hypothetical protein